LKAFIFAKEQDKVYQTVTTMFDRVDDIHDCEVVITIGGDGTILEIGKQAAKANKPLLGINTGRLGFMATLEKDELNKLKRLKDGNYTISRRMLLDVNIGGKACQALNDVVLHRKQTRLPDFSVYRNDVAEDTEILKFRADGIIISTPTGSTAYSLSAGGPIIEPEMECFLVTALCPHSLFNRPMIFSPNTPLCVLFENVIVSVDGAAEQEPQCNGLCSFPTGKIIITKSSNYLDLIDINGNNFYESIHNKLMKPLK